MRTWTSKYFIKKLGHITCRSNILLDHSQDIEDCMSEKNPNSNQSLSEYQWFTKIMINKNVPRA